MADTRVPPGLSSDKAYAMYKARTESSSTASQPPPQTRSAKANLHPAQFGKHARPQGRHAGSPSFGERVKADMARRQGGFQSGQHKAPGKHAKSYNADEDIAVHMSGEKKNYTAKHDTLGLNKDKPVAGKVTKNYRTAVPDKSKGKHAARSRAHLRHSRFEGANARRLRELVK